MALLNMEFWKRTFGVLILAVLVSAGVCRPVPGQVQYDRVESVASPSPDSAGRFGFLGAIGDVNGDGVSDILVGAGGERRVYMLSGSSREVIYALEFSSSVNAFYTPEGLGDIDGDQVPDIVVGAPFEEVQNTFFAGRAYLYSGADGTLIRKIESPNVESVGLFGFIPRGVGDLNGDDVPDVAVPAFNEDGEGVKDSGRLYLFSGSDGGLIHTLTSPNPDSSGNFGFAPVRIGDVNSDGVPDLAVNAEGETVRGKKEAGRAYLFSGADGNRLRTFTSPNPDSAGSFGGTARVGDINGDGVPDVGISATGETVNGKKGAGRTYLFSGKSGNLLQTLESPNPERGGNFGNASQVGDLDEDDIPEIGITSDETVEGRKEAGRTYLFSPEDGRLLQTLESPNPDSAGSFGFPETIADLNNDGVSDIAVAASGETVNGEKEAGRIYIYVSRPTRVPSNTDLTFDAPTDNTSYRPVALPGGETVELESVVNGEPGPQGDYRAYRVEGGDGNVRECGVEGGVDCSFEPGRGLWLLPRDGWSPPDSLQSVSLSENGTYPVSLPSSGWNLISNPFSVAIPWSKVVDLNGGEAALDGLFEWTENGAWRTVEVLKPATSGTGYYVFNAEDSELVLPYPSGGGTASRTDKGESSGTTQTVKQSRAEAQTVALGAYVEGQKRGRVMLGLSSAAEKGLDILDVRAPPTPFGTVSLQASARREENTSEQLLRDYRPLDEKGQRFALRLETSEAESVTVRADSVEVPDRYEVVLVERPVGRTHDLRKGEAVLHSEEENSRLVLLVGTPDYVEEQKKALTPDQVRLLSNYPNPVRQATTIEYGLPQTQDVQLVVYDVLGRRVQVLVDGRQQAGFHRVRWRGAPRLSSGVYFYRLRTGETTKVRKMTVVR